MKQLVIMPGGFHPFHAGHLALYQSAQQAFPGADVKVAATNDTSSRPFPFKLKEKLAQLAGVPPGDFYQVKSPFRADEITRNYDPADTQLIFVRSEKDADQPPRPGGIKKDGNPGYLQPISRNMAPMTQHAYMAYLPTVTFGPGIRSATEIRTAWPKLDERRRMALVMSLYPNTQKNPKLAKTVVRMLDTAMGAELTEVLDTDGPGVSFDSAEGFKNTIRQKLGRSDPELNTNIDQLVVADPDGTVDVDQTLFNMLKEFDELMPQILQFVKDITAKFIETSQSIEFQQASPADQQSLLQSIKDMQAMLPGLEKQVVDARAKFQQNAPIMQQNIQTKAAAAKPVPPVVKEVTRQMSQGGLRASYQSKYNQPISEDYLDEARS